MKTYSLNFIWLLALMFIPMSSCKKETVVSDNGKYSYFPLQVGHEVVYDVDSVVKSEFNLGQVDTFRYQIKEVVESYFLDNEGRETARLERYKRTDATQPWVIHKVWTANLNRSNAEKKEDNITYIKLVFPPAKNKKWNGNAKNEFDEQIYKITSVDVPESFNSLSFDSVLTVLQADEDNIVFKKYEIEKYATGAGMVFKEQFNGNYKLVGSSYVLASFVHYTEKIISFKN